MTKSNLNNNMRVYHRYLGFSLTGIMAIYAISGIIMIFRDTDFLKSEKIIEKTFAPDIKVADLGKAIKKRELKIDKEENDVLYFKDGTFDKKTGIAQYKVKELPFLVEKITHLHKATHKDPLYYLNICFGISLLFFVVSAFWMYLPGSEIFKKGMYFVLGGAILTLIMLFV